MRSAGLKYSTHHSFVHSLDHDCDCKYFVLKNGVRGPFRQRASSFLYSARRGARQDPRRIGHSGTATTGARSKIPNEGRPKHSRPLYLENIGLLLEIVLIFMSHTLQQMRSQPWWIQQNLLFLENATYNIRTPLQCIICHSPTNSLTQASSTKSTTNRQVLLNHGLLLEI